jgi:hypothetical protein
VELLCVRSDEGVVVPKATFHFDQGFDGGLDFLMLFDSHRFSVAAERCQRSATLKASQLRSSSNKRELVAGRVCGYVIACRGFDESVATPMERNNVTWQLRIPLEPFPGTTDRRARGHGPARAHGSRE